MRIGTPSASASSTECTSSNASPHCSFDCLTNCARSSSGVTLPGALRPAAACSSSTAWIWGSRTGGATALHPIRGYGEAMFDRLRRRRGVKLDRRVERTVDVVHEVRGGDHVELER